MRRRSAAFAAGIGAEIEVTLGGQLDRDRFAPLPVTAKVRMLSDGHFFSERSRVPWHAGNSAVLQVGNHIIIATSRAVSLYDRSLFWAHGQEPRHFDAVVVKRSPSANITCSMPMPTHCSTLTPLAQPAPTSPILVTPSVAVRSSH
ncbi:MAG: MlrC C-terminal domain-containing protein [Caldilineaceae bacterium]